MSKTWAERNAETVALHKATLAKEHCLVGHPKLDKLYQLAWDHGHPNGLQEVGFYFGEFAELLK